MPYVFLKYVFRLQLFLLMTLLANDSSGQNNVNKPQRKILTTSDFKGTPDENVDYLANTKPIISLEYQGISNCVETGKVKLKVDTKIRVSERSWMKLSEIRSQQVLAALLSHEQGHYDLQEVLAIDLKKTLSNSCFDRNTYKQQADSIFKSMYARYDTLQRKYDTETDNMRNKTMQAAWKQKIAAMLREIQQ